MPGGTDYSLRVVSLAKIASVAVLNSDQHSETLLTWVRWALGKHVYLLCVIMCFSHLL